MTGLIIIAATAACVLLGQRLTRTYFLRRRTHAGTATEDDLMTLLSSHRHRALPSSTKARLLYACRTPTDMHFGGYLNPHTTKSNAQRAATDGIRLWTEDGYVDYTEPDGLTGTYSTATITRWLLDNHSTSLLLVCFDAGLSDTELLAHCDGSAPITYEQAEMLAGFRNLNG